MTRTIDAHQHFWRTAAQEQPWRTDAHAALERDFLYDDLVPELDAAGVDATVVMQSVDEPAENDRLAEFAAEGRIAGIVAWLDVRSGTAALAELERRSLPKLSGVRCLVAKDPLHWLGDADVLALFRELAARGLAWDVVPITIDQVRAVTTLARAVPDLQIVVDHLGRPPLDTGGWDPWASHLTELAQSPNVAVKVSIGIDALTAWNAWDREAIRPYVEQVVAAFGPSRLMLGSNWPVVLLRASYRDAWTDLRSLAFDLVPDETGRAELLGGTAERVYHLGEV
ncbi:L-fuconolactonase [Diaminobutyricimonas aerilata]|uniref:L-fuconolactonase n=1 Tax=Diaminobutyricimonas aerilata TaxID=1162967 RepID=A0A2M9CMA3_9MICO|nr:amidohydrolase family protein [Diaminobutyricimonas aerilata]PJJ73031.1 L-fuconolactonase [Diaminobutyricimonas aerilata]